MKIYLVRHGLSLGNKAKMHQLPHVVLSEEGVIQANAIAERVSNLSIDLIYSSSLTRAQETAKAISNKIGARIETWDEVREIKRPSEILGKHVDSPETREFDQALEANYKDPDWKYSDEETFNDLKARAKGVLDHLLKTHGDQNILVVSHGTFIKMLVATVLFGENLTADVFWDFREHTYAENTGISVCENRPGKGWRLLTFSDSSHL
ncbi:MAG TPA: histidine phosphatase family protein [Patescibacteria group bacterium]|nr:histidine phosphatase family protein [Patescibacteria group bacterium]